MEIAAPRFTSEQITAAIARADGLFTQREDPAKLREAVDALLAVRDWDHPTYEVEWKLARYNYFLGKQTADKKEQERIFGAGRDSGQTAARLEPGRAEGHFWYGANLGELARMDPFVIGLKSVSEIRNSMNKVLEIQPNYQNSSAYDALAQVELETRFTGGSAQKAAELIEKALETERDNTNLHLHLAMAYLQLGREADARKQLDRVVQAKVNPEYAIEHRESLAKARDLLATKF